MGLQIVIHPIPNFGDLLNIPLFRYYFGEETWFVPWHLVGPGAKAVLGIGTLIDYMIPAGWFADKEVTFLGTGAARISRPITIYESHGFVRGPLTEQKTHTQGLGDPGILIDKVFGIPKERCDRTAVVVGKFRGTVDLALPSPERFSPDAFDVYPISQSGLEAVYQRIGTARFVFTDRLHVATTAEALGIPWVIWNHGQGDIADTPDKFHDWAMTIGKERFILTDPALAGIVEENTNFDLSVQQKERLDRILTICGKEVLTSIDSLCYD